MNSLRPGLAPPVSIDPQAPPAAAARQVFRADQPGRSDSLGGAAALDHAAELVAHAGAQTPLTIGLFGGAGAGKSHALELLVARAQALAAGATALAGKSPFLSRLAIVRLSAPLVVEDTASAVASAVHDALAAPASGPGFAAFARDAAQSATDPFTAAREANRRLDDTRRQLDSDRRALEELGARRARLGETLLYEAAGSSVDAYARSQRTSIESRLRTFGFNGEPIATYKDLVRDAAEHQGVSSRISAFFRSLWMFQGQARLIIWAILFFLIAWGAGLAQASSATWLPWLAGLNENAAPVADWLRMHLAWFGPIRQGAIAIACLCVLLNIWRALRFLAPLMRGARLLRGDVETRRREIDSQIAHQTRRVDALAAEADAHARNAAEAEKRASEGAQTDTVNASGPLFPETGADNAAGRARLYLGSLETAMARGADNAPQRILVALDELDGVAPARAAAMVEAVHRLVARPGFALLICADARHLAAGWSGAADASQRLQRLVQIPLSVAPGGGDDALRAYARGLLAGAPKAAQAQPIDARSSALDQPMPPAEADAIAALAPLAGETPRAIKRFINIYRLARARGGDLAALGLMLALDSGGATGELNAMGAAMDMEQPDRELTVHPGEPRLAAALAAVNAARGKPLTIAEAQQAWTQASDYRSPL